MTSALTEVWAVSSGSYSDYSVHCIFELKEDARTYARFLAEKSLGETHRQMVAYNKQYGRSGPHEHAGPGKTCEECNRRRSGWQDEDFDDFGAQAFQFYPSGSIPVVTS